MTTRERESRWPEGTRSTLGRYTIFDLVRLVRRSPTTGREHEFLRLESADWVNVIAVTADHELILVEQFRHGTDETTLEIPGGCVDPGEEPSEAARRELEEETGYRCGELVLIGSVTPNPAFLSNRCWTYLASACRADGRRHLDPSEEIVVRLVEPRAFGDLIDDRSISHALVVAAHDHLQRGLHSGAPWATRWPR